MADNVIEVEARLKDYISTNLNNLEANLVKFQKETAQASKQTNILGDGLGKLVRHLAPAALAAAAVAKTYQAMKESFNLADKISNLNKQLDISTDTLQTLDVIAIQSGTSMEALANGVIFLQRSMVEAADSTSKEAKLFKEMGVTLEDQNGNLRDAEAVYKDVLKVLAEMPNKQERVAVAMQLMGRAGKEILPVLSDLGGDFNKLSMNMKDSGLVMSEETVKNLDAVGDAFDRLWRKAVVFTGTQISELMQSFGKKQEFKMSAGVSDEPVKAVAAKATEITKILNDKNKEQKDNKIRSWEEEQAEQQKFLAEDEIARMTHQRKVKDEEDELLDKQIAEKHEKLQLSSQRERELWEKNAEAKARYEESIRMQSLLTMDAYMRTNSAIMQMGRLAIQDAKMGAEKKKNILKGTAVADAAGAAVKGIYTVWSGEGETWYKIAMTAVTVAEIAAMAATQIGQINAQKFARGSRSTPGGMAIVGDAGPELLRLPMGSTIYNNSETRNMLGGNNFNINLSIPSGARVDDSAARTISDSMKQLGEMLVNADRNGYLRDFRSRIAA